MKVQPSAANELSSQIIGAAIEVQRLLGPGLLESIYDESLAMELTQRGLRVNRQVDVPVRYKDTLLGTTLKLDLLVNEMIVVEIKAIERLLKIHEAQLLTYIRLSDKRLGLLINFNSEVLTHSIRRVVNGL